MGGVLGERLAVTPPVRLSCHICVCEFEIEAGEGEVVRGGSEK